jgi:L-ribulose-5-phosphate 3-epimerase
VNQLVTPFTVPLAPADGPVCGIGDEGAAALHDQIRLHRELGLSGLELRTVDGLGVHQLSDTQALAAAEAVAAAGLIVPVVDSPLGSWSVNVGVSDADELNVLHRAARNAGVFGCRHLRIMSYPNDGRPGDEWRVEALRKVKVLVEAADDLDVVLLHENCSGWAGTDARRTIELIAEVDSPRLRLLFDLGNGIAYGYPSLPFLREVLPWVRHVHVKDGTIVDGEVVFGLPGEGDAQLTDCLQLLADASYRGWYSVEPHITFIPHASTSGDPSQKCAAYYNYVQRFRELLDSVIRTPPC